MLMDETTLIGSLFQAAPPLPIPAKHMQWAPPGCLSNYTQAFGNVSTSEQTLGGERGSLNPVSGRSRWKKDFLYYKKQS